MTRREFHRDYIAYHAVTRHEGRRTLNRRLSTTSDVSRRQLIPPTSVLKAFSFYPPSTAFILASTHCIICHLPELFGVSSSVFMYIYIYGEVTSARSKASYPPSQVTSHRSGSNDRSRGGASSTSAQSTSLHHVVTIQSWYFT
jgi:hypothetical protein